MSWRASSFIWDSWMREAEVRAAVIDALHGPRQRHISGSPQPADDVGIDVFALVLPQLELDSRGDDLSPKADHASQEPGVTVAELM
jgi:hypothetical protein